MKTINNISLDVSYLKKGPFHTIEEAGTLCSAYSKVVELGQKTRVMHIVKDNNGSYWVESLTINNEEYKEHDDNCTKDEALQILSGVSKTVSQIEVERSRRA